MPPKRKAAAKKTPAAKKQKVSSGGADEAGPADVKATIAALKRSDQGRRKRKVDAFANIPGGEVYEDYDVMLNQTNIGHNNNKFYVIQVISASEGHYCFTRWGRVGDSGQNMTNGAYDTVDEAIKDFKKKFQDKTRNKWEQRDKFTAKPGKYTMIEMGDDDDNEDAEREALKKLDAAAAAGKNVTYAPSTLDPKTQMLIKLIFSSDTFQSAMAAMELDTKKMPLGKLSKTQIAKGFEVLEELEDLLKQKKPNSAKVMDVSSQFYTVIPHNFGRQRPPPINTSELLQKKFDMLATLADIELAQEIQKEAKRKSVTKGATQLPNPVDINYKGLGCQLELLDPQKDEFKMLKKYYEDTKGGHYRNTSLQEIWKVSRDGEAARLAQHKALTNRRLLWHGTGVAVVAAILGSGLRIMPHSGGCFGKGIYHSSMHAKSIGYVRAAGGTGLMFLDEVVLGKEYFIDHSDSSLVRPPKGYDSVVYLGGPKPDFSRDVRYGGYEHRLPVRVPQTAEGYSEYLVYRESQVSMRYLLKFNVEW